MRSEPIRVRDLKDQMGMPFPRPSLYCSKCNSLFSANAGDYFAAQPDTILKHCDRPMRLVIKRVTLEDVAC